MATANDASVPPSSDVDALPPSYEPAPGPRPRVHFREDQLPPQKETDNESLLPTYSAAKYGIYGSEAEYLAALKAWVQEKAFVEPSETTLVGFYGKTTMEEYANKPGGVRTSCRDKKGQKVGAQAQVLEEPPQSADETKSPKAEGVNAETKKKGSVTRWLKRSRTKPIVEGWYNT